VGHNILEVSPVSEYENLDNHLLVAPGLPFV